MISSLRKRRQRLVLDKAPIDDTVWHDLLRRQTVLRGLDGAEQQRLRELATLFRHDKHFYGAAGLEVDEGMRVQIAALACLPILKLDLDLYRAWRTIIVYPGGFRVRQVVEDDAGIVHEIEDELSGEAWLRGPLVLSWEDAQNSLPADGYNVVIHECCHKLDMLNGEANGFPPLHEDMSVEEWSRSFGDAYESLCRRVEQGGSPGVLDVYACESPAEFFAVASEAFFEIPAALRDEHPAVYAQLAAYYRQEPLVRMEIR